MSYGGVSESETKKTLVLEAVFQPFLQLAQVCHNLARKRFYFRAG